MQVNVRWLQSISFFQGPTYAPGETSRHDAAEAKRFAAKGICEIRKGVQTSMDTDPRETTTDAVQWELKMDPSEYLKRFGDEAPHSEAAKQLTEDV